MKSKIVIYALLFVVAFIIIRECQTSFMMITDNNQTTAKVTKVQGYSSTDGQLLYYIINFEYEADNKTYDKEFMVSNNTFSEGESVDIIYVKSNPTSIMYKSSCVLRFVKSIIGVVIVVILLMYTILKDSSRVNKKR